MTRYERTTMNAVRDVRTDASMEAILECLAQPVSVVDHEGFIIFLNPAGLEAFGYDDLSELKGKPGHETLHYKRPDGSPYPVEECPMAKARQTGERVHRDEDWFVRRDGTMFPARYTSTPINTPNGPGVVVSFTDIEEQRKAEQAARERDVAEARAEELRVARRRIIEAADAARAQLVRDLHDGAQQQFVSAVLNLKMAEGKASSDPDEARELREHAVELANLGIAELRRLAAGIHPAILTDRGLEPAIQALASRLPIAVSVIGAPADRPPEPVEASVYFFISEALTNVVKHARTDEAKVRVVAADDRLTVEVSDDGVGGAHETGGSGLHGLGDRVGALDGVLEIQSPPGEGTLLRAQIPLRSAAR
jgi:PAS domain S-box-containing protein